MTVPTDGTTTIDNLIAAVRNGSDFVRADAALEVRTIAVKPQSHDWYNFATIARVTASTDESRPQLIRLGSVAVTWVKLQLEEINDTDGLRKALAHWRTAVGASSGFAFDNSWNVDRKPTGNLWSDLPCWVATGYEEIEGRPSYGQRGPFFDLATGLFGEDLGGLAVEWLNAPWLNRQNTTQHSYEVMLPDARARFTRYEAEGNELRFFVDTVLPESQLRGAAVSEQFGGTEHRQARPVKDGVIRFSFPGSVKSLRVWLFNDDGSWLDQYYESGHGASWGPSIYNAPRGLHDDAYAAVQHALGSGETESVEFKAWVDPKPGSKKAAELPRSVVAFANRGAGEIFIGINDDGEVQDITQHLKRLYGTDCGDDRDCLVAAYVRDVRKVIAEDVTPQPQVVIEPVVIAEQQLLRISVSRGEKGPYSLVRDGTALLRRGATNKSIAAAELAELIRAAGGTFP